MAERREQVLVRVAVFGPVIDVFRPLRVSSVFRLSQFSGARVACDVAVVVDDVVVVAALASQQTTSWHRRRQNSVFGPIRCIGSRHRCLRHRFDPSLPWERSVGKKFKSQKMAETLFI